jgi:hypothetical protein
MSADAELLAWLVRGVMMVCAALKYLGLLGTITLIILGAVAPKRR